jgi:predicted RNase H-like nuclease (RuvC/YqgF family)
MIAYREHIKQIQAEIDKLKNESNDQRYMELKKQKIETLESKLSQIRKQALFLGDMSELH